MDGAMLFSIVGDGDDEADDDDDEEEEASEVGGEGGSDTETDGDARCFPPAPVDNDTLSLSGSVHQYRTASVSTSEANSSVARPPLNKSDAEEDNGGTTGNPAKHRATTAAGTHSNANRCKWHTAPHASRNTRFLSTRLMISGWERRWVCMSSK